MPSSPCAAAAASARARSSSASERTRTALLVLLTAGITFVAASCVGQRTGAGSQDASSDATIGSTTAGAVTPNGVVAKIVDGDTIDVAAEAGGERTRVRLIGLDTPESVDPRRPVECFGKEASKHLAALAPVGTPVRLERDAEATDRYGRTLAYVYRAADGLFLNLQMVADGYAHVLSIPPNISYADQFRDAERSARGASLGLWSSCPDA